ncbi:ATP-binding protein [Undibacterium sp. TJN25]|uniref:sensor histidine kinase n=1 Tax=Undibacterium sp. TJN25 TaxID=3413056 RepID=UPI003BF32A21
MPSRNPSLLPRLTTLLTISICSTVIVIVLALLFMVDHFAVDYAQKEARQRLQQLSWQMRDSLDLVMQKAVGDVQLLAQLSQVKDARDPKEVGSILDNLQKTFPSYAWIGLANPDGKVFASTQGLLEGQDVSERPWFKSGKLGLYAGDYHPALLLEKKLPYSADPWRFVDVAIPVYRSDGAKRGIMGVHLSWGWARDLAKNLLAPTDSQYAVEIMVVREDNTVILGPKALEEKKVMSHSMELSRSGQTGAVTERWPDGNNYLTGYSQTGRAKDRPGLKWSILVRQPEAVALAASRQLRQNILLLGGGLGLLLAGIAALLARRLAEPLNQLSAAIEKRGNGQTGQQIPVVNTFHEAHVLSMALAQMVANEEQHVQALRKMNENLESTVAERTREIEDKARELETALKQQQGTQLRLQAITDNLPSIITYIDAGQRYVFVNAHATSVFGVAPDRMLGMTLKEISGDKIYAALLPHIEAALRGETVSFEMEGIAGNQRNYQFNYIPAKDSKGAVEGFYAMTFDITDRKRVEAMKNEFVSTVSHELRTPLTSINGALKLIVGGVAGEVAPKARELLTVALRNADRLVRLINDILDIEKIESGNMEFDLKSSPLNGLITDAISAGEGFAGQYGVHVNFRDAGEDLSVKVDRDRFAQVLANLLSNAIKFSETGGEVEVLVENKGSTVKVTVADYGSGIPADFHDKIFQKFTQVDSSNTKKKGGTGLGLNICKTIIEHMHGTIGFRSTAGLGSQFFFELPLEQIQTAEALPQHQ